MERKSYDSSGLAPNPERCCLCHSPTLRPWIAPPPAARAR
jgi:hypothetical protein